MCEVLIFNTQKRYEKQKNFGNSVFGNFLKKIATFWQLLDTFIGNFFGIHRQLVDRPKSRPNLSKLKEIKQFRINFGALSFYQIDRFPKIRYTNAISSPESTLPFFCLTGEVFLFPFRFRSGQG